MYRTNFSPMHLVGTNYIPFFTELRKSSLKLFFVFCDLAKKTDKVTYNLKTTDERGRER